MSWVKMDDRWPSSKKLRRVEPLDRLLWVMSIAYCSEQNTDGRLDGPMLELIAFLAGVTMPYESAGRLVDAKLFDLDAGGWKVHDYLGFQPSSAQRNHISQARSEAGKLGGTRSGEGRKKPKGTTEANGKQVAEAEVPKIGTPSSPVPSRPLTTSTSHLVYSAGESIGSGTDGSIDQRITDTFTAWLRIQAVEGPQQIPPNDTRRIKGYIQQAQLTIDQHWPALKALAQANPTTPPDELAALYRKPKP